MKKYGLHGKLTAKEGKEDKDEKSIWITEVWETKEAHDNSLNIKGVKELISEAIPILDGQPGKGQELLVLGGFGIK